MRTRVVLGSLINPNFIHQQLYDLVKLFVVTPPALVSTDTNLIWFEVSHEHVSRGGNPRHRYFIETNETLEYISMNTYSYYHDPLLLHCSKAHNPEQFDRLSIYREVVQGPFRLKPEAVHTDSIVIEERTSSTLEGWGYLWEIRLEKRWVCPYHSSIDLDKLIYRCKPNYSVEIYTEGNPTVEMIKKFIRFSLPNYFDGVYLPLCR